MGCIALAIVGDAIPPGADDAQQGVAMQQSIMQFIGQLQQVGHCMHGIMHGSMHFIGQSAMAERLWVQTTEDAEAVQARRGGTACNMIAIVEHDF